MTRRFATSSPAPLGTRFRIEDAFYGGAQDLRAQFDDAVLNSSTNAGMTPFAYAFCANAYHFLTASAERIFRQDSIDAFKGHVRSWSVDVVQASRVTTPQVRVYVGGCRRIFARDNVSQPWHYLLCLSVSNVSQNLGCVRILPGDDAESNRAAIGRELLSVRLGFNQMLVHSTAYSYSIETTTLSMNPSEGFVLVDGYVW